MKKYQSLFLSKLNKERDRFYKEGSFHKKEEILAFLHTVKGTAPTIALDELGEQAEILHRKLEKEPTTDDLSANQIREWLSPLFDTLNEEEEASSRDRQRHPVAYQSMPASSHNGTILIIDDDITLLTYMRDLLEKEGFTTVVQMDSLKALQSFYDTSPDLIVLDYQLKGTDGFQWLDTIKEKADLLLIPVVMVSGDQSKTTRLSAYEAGLDDYIQKPFEPDEFLVRIKAAFSRKHLLREAVLIDELTGAFNRKFMQRSLTRHIALFEQYGLISSLILMDLDKFKSVNDTYGHPVGDQVLKRFSTYIQENKRQSDSLIRIGGEEFLLVLPNTGQNEACSLANHWLKGFSKVTHVAGDVRFTMTFSAGLIEINKTGISNAAWFEWVDNSLYLAKSRGRNQVVIYEDSLPVQIESPTLEFAIVDDSSEVRETIKTFLSNGAIKEKRQITFFSDGASFLKSNWLSKEGMHILILDSHLKDLTGIHILSELKDRQLSESIITLMLMETYSEDDILKAIELGADDYMIKPFNQQDGATRLMQLLNRFVRRTP